MQDLPTLIDNLYSTYSDVERRETMAKLTAFLATPNAWQALIRLFAIALTSVPGNMNEQKRRHRICFFAGNALLSKIRKEMLRFDEANELTQSIHGLIVARSPTSIQVRDPKAELLGKPTVKRLILCLATLASTDADRLHGYVDHALSLLAVSNHEANSLALEMLLAIANPTDDEEDADDSTGTRPMTEIPQSVRGAAAKVVPGIESYIRCSTSNPPMEDNTLLLECIRAWIAVLNSSDGLRTMFPLTFTFGLRSLSTETRVEALRSASSIFEWLAEFCRLSEDMVTKDALLEGILMSRHSFKRLRDEDDEDGCHAIAVAFAKVAECDASRIARGGYAKHGEVIDFAVEILAHPNRSSVARNVLDFFLCIQDIPLVERVPGLNEQFFLGLLGRLVLSCEVPKTEVPTMPEDEDGAGDVLLYRASSDGPRDLFGSIYGVLVERYVHELVAIIANPEFDFLRSEAALFALRSASKEICAAVSRQQDVAKQQHQRLALLDLFDRFLRISFRSERYFRASMCATIAEFSSVLHVVEADLLTQGGHSHNTHHRGGAGSGPPGTIALNLEFVLKNLEDPSADALLEHRASFTFLKLCSRHSKALAPFLQTVFVRLLASSRPFNSKEVAGLQKNVQVHLENRRFLAEGLSRLCSVHGDPSAAAKSCVDAILNRVRQSRGNQLEIETLAALVKYFPPDNKFIVESVSVPVWTLLEDILNGNLGMTFSEEQVDALSSLFGAFFFCCSSIITQAMLEKVLLFVVQSFVERPSASLAQVVGKAVELFSNNNSIFSSAYCNEILLSLISRPEKFVDSPDSIPSCLEAIRRAFLFVPEAVFGGNRDKSRHLCEFIMTCTIAEERETVREGCVVLADFINRTRSVTQPRDITNVTNSSTTNRNSGEKTRWNIFGPVLDDMIWNTGLASKLAEHIARLIVTGDRALVAENLSDLLYCLLRAYPISLPSWNSTIEQTAASSSKESFRRFMLSKASRG